MMYKNDPLTGIKIVYDKRIKVGDLRWDNKNRFFRMNPKTKPTLEKGIAYANAKDLFKRLENRSPYNDYYVMKHAMNPPIIINSSYLA